MSGEGEVNIHHDNPRDLEEQIHMLEVEIRRKPAMAEVYDSALKDLRRRLATLRAEETEQKRQQF